MTAPANRRVGEPAWPAGRSAQRQNGFFAGAPVRRCAPSSPRRRWQSGQSFAEVMLMVPLFVLLGAGALAIGYMCWQGLKVQQAANLAARIQGQQRVGGGIGVTEIRDENVGSGDGDTLPDDNEIKNLAPNADMTQRQRRPADSSVYGQFYRVIHDLFGEGERKKLLIPKPVTGLNSDQVTVVRVMNPPSKLLAGLKLPSIEVRATAYGGEDTRMYALPAGAAPKARTLLSTKPNSKKAVEMIKKSSGTQKIPGPVRPEFFRPKLY